MEALAANLIEQGDTLSLIGESQALEYDVKTLLINAVDQLPESKLQSGLRKNATFHARKLLEL